MKMDLITIGFLVVFIGIIIISLGALGGKGENKFAVGGFIGFIQFGFANDKRMLWGLLIIMAVFVFMNLRFLL